MERKLLKDFQLDHKNPSEEALQRWRSAVSIAKNGTRRFRHVADLAKRSAAELKRRKIQEKIRAALYCQKAALEFFYAGVQPEFELLEEDTKESFGESGGQPEYKLLEEDGESGGQPECRLSEEDTEKSFRESGGQLECKLLEEHTEENFGESGGQPECKLLEEDTEESFGESGGQHECKLLEEHIEENFGESGGQPECKLLEEDGESGGQPECRLSEEDTEKSFCESGGQLECKLLEVHTEENFGESGGQPECKLLEEDTEESFGVSGGQLECKLVEEHTEENFGESGGQPECKLLEEDTEESFGESSGQPESKLLKEDTEESFGESGGQPECKLLEEDTENGLDIHPDKLASIVDNKDINSLKILGGVEGIARKIDVSLNEGVNTKDLPTRQKNYGFNRFTERPSKKFLMLLWKSLQDSPPIIPVLSAMISIGSGILTEGWPKGIYDGFGGILGLFLVIMVKAFCKNKLSLQLKDLYREKKNIQVTRDGKREKVSIYDLVVGDIVHLSIGDQVPADGIYISGYSLLINKLSLPDENKPVNVYEENPFLLSGSIVQNGSGKMLVTTVGMRSKWGKLMETLNEGGEDKTPLQAKLNSVASNISKTCRTFSVLTFLILIVRYLVVKALNYEFTGWSSRDALTTVIYFATAVSILDIVIHEVFPLAVTLSLGLALRKLKEERALVIHPSACETMGSASCICTDKTGTLTTNDMEVDKLWIPQKSIDVKGNAREVLKKEIPERVFDILLQAIIQNTGSEVVNDDYKQNTILGASTESALLKFGLLLGDDFDAQHREFKILKVKPFNSVEKKMSVLAALSDGRVRAFCKGAFEIILSMCDKIVDCNGEPVLLSEEQVKKITDVINGFASGALRTLCLAFKDVDDTSIDNSIPDSGYTLIAVVGIKDPVCPGVKNAVLTCRAAGITVRMVTGDNIYTAKASARECGILTENGVLIKGPEFRCMSPEQIKDIIPRIQVMASSSPSDKHFLVYHLRKRCGKVVAVVTGDGTNDALALHASDVQLAMGIAGTQVAKDSAEVIILDENCMPIVNVARWGRALYINSQNFLQCQLTVIVVTLVLHFAFACISGSAPVLTPVQLLWVTFMDAVGALALVIEPPNDELMKRSPVDRDVSFITKAMWRNIIGHSIYQLAVLAILNVDGKRLLNLSGSDATDVLNTLIFNSFVFCQVFNNINSREIENINILRGMFDSWIFLGVMVGTVAFQVIMVEFLGDFASTVPLSWQLWLLSVLLGSVSLLVAVILKCVPVRDTTEHHDVYGDNLV